MSRELEGCWDLWRACIGPHDFCKFLLVSSQYFPKDKKKISWEMPAFIEKKKNVEEPHVPVYV